LGTFFEVTTFARRTRWDVRRWDAEKKEDAMELLDRYLGAVRKHLPWERQDDIIAELRANLESQVEEKEEELGRPMTGAEAEAWLKQVGPPMQMAARYHAPRYLIGPGLFPIYWYVMKLAWFWAALVCTIVSVVQLAVGTPRMDDVVSAVLHVPLVLMMVAAWVTATFAALEYVARRYPEKCPEIGSTAANWEPGSLPPVERREEGQGKPGSQASAAAGVIFSVLGLCWLLLIPEHPFLMMGPGVVFFKAHGIVAGAPLWQFYWWIVALNVLQLGWRAVDLARGTWRGRHRAYDMTGKAMGLIPMVLLLAGPHVYLVMQGAAADTALFGTTLEQVNHWTYFGVAVVTAIGGAQLAVDLWRMGTEARRKRVAMGR
jgi:hypothetical protein